MKHIFLICIFAFHLSCYSQNQKAVVTEIDYIPIQRTEVTDQEYRKWSILLKNSYEQIKEDSGKMIYADHFNLATAFMQLKEPKDKVLDHLRLAQEEDLESTAELFPRAYNSLDKVQGNLTATEYDSLLKKFAAIVANKKEIKIDPNQYAVDNNLNSELVKLMAYLNEKDQQFRMTNRVKQKIIDLQNIQIIDSLYEVYRKYIGNSLVGKEYESSMWVVIQHSDLEHQEKYLPVVLEGVQNGELPETPLKMLIDRVYKKKYGYQIFGTQSGSGLAEDVTIQKVKSEYGL